SREFLLLGTRVQIFQRLILQIGPDGNARTMNLLDAGLMPYTSVNGSTYPAPDTSLARETPSPAEADYGSRIIEFVKAAAPDTWEGTSVRFLTTFNETVSYQVAFPDNDQPESLLPLVNLEIWGAPTSRPAYDPNNRDFIYQRFQRGIAHYRRACGCTEGVLLGDYFKAILTGENLPADLAAQAKDSPFYRQYAPAAVAALARPKDLAASDLSLAFVKQELGQAVAQPGATVTATAPPAPTIVPVPTTVPAAPVAASGRYVAKSPEYGLNVFVWGNSGTTSRDLGRLKELGFGWQKTLFQWREIEGACKGCFNWSEADRVIQASNANGVNVLARLDFQPKWASAAHNGPPSNYQDFADFVSALVSRYKTGSPYGRLHAIEIWNEVNLAREWGDKPINRQQAGDYVRLLKLAYQAAKAADPNITVVTAGLSPTGWNDDTARPDDVYLQWLYDAGMRGSYDVLGAHGNSQSPDPTAALNSDPRFPHPSFYFRRVEQLRDIMVKNGDADKQVWLLEFGWTADQVHPAYAWYAVSEERKAANVVGAFLYATRNWAPWIGVMTLWTLPDPSWTTEREELWWAVTNTDGSPRPAYEHLLRSSQELLRSRQQVPRTKQQARLPQL
ncbi:MAG: hypothetical protein HY718_21555, partial [Planctomycetes bacterium]|nr:hypothetical protein [Planctomycetota bacterium]